MNKFKTIVGRLTYNDEFDRQLEKAFKQLEEDGHKAVEYRLSISDNMIVAIIEYKPKKVSGKPRQADTAQA